MVATTKQMRAAIVKALTSHLGTEDQQIVGYVIRNPTMPTIWCRPRPDMPITYGLAMGAEDVAIQKWDWLVEAYAGVPDDIESQMLIDEYVNGSKHIVKALAADSTLGGVVQNSSVLQCNAYVEFIRADGNPAIGANWQLEIYP